MEELSKNNEELASQKVMARETTRREFLIEAGKSTLGLLLLSQLENDEQKRYASSVDFLFGPHISSRDLVGFEGKLEKADIYIPEMFGWAEDLKEDFQAVADGKKEPETMLLDRGVYPINFSFFYYLLESLKLVYNTGKKIEFIDIPQGHPLAEKQAKKDFGNVLGHQFRFTESELAFENNLEELSDFLKEGMEFNKEREQYILKNLKKLIDKSEKYPPPSANRSEKKVNILLSLGAEHTPIYHELKKSGRETSRLFNKMPFVYGLFLAEADRRYTFGKEVDKELLSKVLIEAVVGWIITYNLRKVTGDTQEILEFQKKIVERFSYQEVKNIFTHEIEHKGYYPEKLGETANRNFDFFVKLIEKKMEEMGISLPKTEGELDLILTNKN